MDAHGILVSDKPMTPAEAHRACVSEIARMERLLGFRGCGHKFPKGWKRCAQRYLKELREMLPDLKARAR